MSETSDSFLKKIIKINETFVFFTKLILLMSTLSQFLYFYLLPSCMTCTNGYIVLYEDSYI